MNALAVRVGSFLDGPSATSNLLLVKLTLMLGIAWGVHAALRNRNPRWRVLWWRSTAAAMLLVTALAFWPPFLRIAVLAPQVADETIVNRSAEMTGAAADRRIAAVVPETRAIATSAPTEAATISAPNTVTDSLTRDARSDRAETSKNTDAAPVTGSRVASSSIRADSPSLPTVVTRATRGVSNALWMVWGGGILIGCVGTLAGFRRLSAIRTRATPVPPWVHSEALRAAGAIGLGRTFEIRQTKDVHSPCVVGLQPALILLPEEQCDPSCRDELPSILAHELAHLRGGDIAWNHLMKGLSILFWFHPLIWKIRSTHADACDAVSDAVAARFVGDAALYGRILARLTLRATGPRTVVGLAMARKSSVRGRIEAVRRHVFADGLPRMNKACAVGIVLALTCALGGLGLTRSEAEPKKSRDAETSNSKTETANVPKAAVSAEAGIVTGEVVSAEGGAPIVGATVLMRDTRLHKATTDDQGRFRFEKIAQGKYLIWAYKENLASAREHLDSQESPADKSSDDAFFAPIRLSMSVGKEMKLSVLSAASGKAVEGADVRLSYPDRRAAKTDASGLVVVPGLLPEKYEVTIQATGHAFLRQDVELSGASSVEAQTISLKPGGIVRGVVTDEEGKPVAGADIHYNNAGSPSGYSGDSPKSDAQGEFIHRYLPLDTQIRVSVQMRDRLTEQREVVLSQSQKEQQLAIQIKRRPPGGSITGIVTDRDGKPIAGAKVGSYGNRYEDVREATTDAAGRFVLHDLFKNFSGFEIFVQGQGFTPLLKQVQPGTAEAPAEVAVQLEPGHSLRGRLQSADGKPIRGAYVMDNSHNQGKRPHQLMNSVKTDAEGRFAFDSLCEDTTFRISAKGFSTRAEESLPLDGEQVVTVTLEPTGVLRGKVVDASTQEGIPQFTVRLGFCRKKEPGDLNVDYDHNLSNPGLTVRSVDGSFTLNELTNRGAVELTIEAEGYEKTVVPRAVVHLADDKTSVDIPLKKQKWQKLATLAGTVLDGAGKPAAGVQVLLIVTAKPSKGDDDNQYNWALIDSGQLGQKPYVEQYLVCVTDQAGQFKFSDLLPNKYLQIAYSGPKVPKGRFLGIAKTKPGMEQTVKIELPKPAIVRGTFDGALFSKAGSVQLSGTQAAFLNFEVPLAGGKSEFTFDNIPPGEYWVSVVSVPERDKENPQFSVQRPLASRKLTIEPGGNYEVKFTAADAVKEPNR